MVSEWPHDLWRADAPPRPFSYLRGTFPRIRKPSILPGQANWIRCGEKPPPPEAFGKSNVVLDLSHPKTLKNAFDFANARFEG